MTVIGCRYRGLREIPQPSIFGVRLVSNATGHGLISLNVNKSKTGKAVATQDFARYWRMSQYTIYGTMRTAMFATREDIIALLKTYPKLQKKINILEYERLHPSKVSQDEVISGLALGHPLTGISGAAGHISNKTMQIALNFQDEADRLNYATILEIDQELHALRQRIEKLEFYVSQLNKKQAEVIRKFYFEEKTWPEIQKEMHISSRTLSKYRDDGLDALVAMKQYMGKVLK